MTADATAMSLASRTDERPAIDWPRAVTILVGLGIVMTILLRLSGRRWWCAFGDTALFTLDAWGPHNSQHLFDAYTFSHVLHGVILYFVFNVGRMRRFPTWQLFCVLSLEAAWEVLENSPLIIDRYRNATAAIGYTGDSVANSLADYGVCFAGWLISRRFGWKIAILMFLVMEIGCLLWVHDNLTLNVLMLLHPVESIQKWQAGAQ